MTTPVGRKTVATPGVQRAPVAAAKVETQAPAAAPSKGWTMKAPGARAVAAPVAAPGASALSDKATRLKLAQVPQENAISGLAKNGNRVCGGAAVVGALIMRSGTTEGAQANSRALSDALFKSGADRFLPDSVNHDALKLAFERFGAGNPNAGDVALLQQAAYAVGCKFAGGDKGDGLSGGQLAGLVADLKTRGATLGPETRFVQVHDGVGGHWVAQAPEALINSAPATKVKTDQLAKNAAVWSADVSVKADGLVELRTRSVPGHAKAWEGGGWTIKLDPPRPNNVADLMTKGDTTQQLLRRLGELATVEPTDL